MNSNMLYIEMQIERATRENNIKTSQKKSKLPDDLAMPLLSL